MHGGCLNQQTRYTAISVCGVWNDMLLQVQSGPAWITHNALSSMHNASVGT